MAHGYPSTLDRYYDAIARTGRNPGNLRFFVEYVFEGVDLTGKTVLDVGAGDGRFSCYAAAAGAREVVSLEPRRQPAPRAGKLAPSRNWFRCSIIPT
jgi:2-polyprenyl-3-methyl-5-hydroxy-6-metoxy-1,4-benzoquinol methylase